MNTTTATATRPKCRRIRYQRYNQIVIELSSPTERHELRLFAKRQGCGSIKEYVIALVRREREKLRGGVLPMPSAAA